MKTNGAEVSETEQKKIIAAQTKAAKKEKATANKELLVLNLSATLTTEILGSTPKDESIYQSYIAAKGKEVGADTRDEHASPTAEDVKDMEIRGWTGFRDDGQGPYIFDYVLKGFLKAAADTIKATKGLEAARNKMDNYVFIRPRKIYLHGKKLDKPVERSLRVMTMQGPRVTLARSDAMAEGTTFAAEIHILPGPITLEFIRDCLDYGKYKGLGQFRNGGYGSFDYTLSSKTEQH